MAFLLGKMSQTSSPKSVVQFACINVCFFENRCLSFINVSARSLSEIIALTKDRRRKLTLKSKCIARIVTRYCQKQEYVSKNDDILLERQIKTKHAMMKLEKR